MTRVKTAGPVDEHDESADKPIIRFKIIGFLLGCFILIAMLVHGPVGDMPQAAWTVAAISLLMAVWWVFEAIPISATALVPIAVFPVLGVASIETTAAPYANPLVFLFLGGFVLALTMERWNLHRRIALTILRVIGTNPVALVGGFMVATAFLSMWVSNTATATMMLPIGVSVLALALSGSGPADRGARLAPALMLGIAYSASIGGIGTLIGTPPNALLAGYFHETYGVTISFAKWMMMAVPLEIVLLVITWFVLTRIVFPVRTRVLDGVDAMIEEEIEKLGPMSRGEKMVGTIFVLTALLWVFRPMINDVFPGIGLSDPGIAILSALVVFVLPVEPKKGIFLFEWSYTSRLPWGVLLLFGGGLSLGSAINASGLSQWIATSLGGVSDVPMFIVLLGIVVVVMAISHLTSNTATAAAFLPLTAATAISLGENPLFLSIPMALAASCVFMLPVATPPNAIVFASGHITVAQMARAGAAINVIALILLMVVSYWVIGFVFGIEAGVLPDWVAGH